MGCMNTLVRACYDYEQEQQRRREERLDEELRDLFDEFFSEEEQEIQTPQINVTINIGSAEDLNSLDEKKISAIVEEVKKAIADNTKEDCVLDKPKRINP